MTAVPKYGVKPSSTVTIDISKFSEAQVDAIAMDMNQKGYLVGIENESTVNGEGVWFSALTSDWTVDDYDADDASNFLAGESTLYCIKPTEAQLKKLGKDKSVYIGDMDDYKVIVRGDKLVVGCQSTTKANAIKLARGILKAFGAQS